MVFSSFIAGTGGGMLLDSLSLDGPQWSLTTPTALRGGNPGAQLGLLGAMLFFGLVNPHGWLPNAPLLTRGQAKFVIYLFLLLGQRLHPGQDVQQTKPAVASTAQKSKQQ
jgi:hypothetical protein